MFILFVSFFGEILTVISVRRGGEWRGVKAKQMGVRLGYRLNIDCVVCGLFCV